MLSSYPHKTFCGVLRRMTSPILWDSNIYTCAFFTSPKARLYCFRFWSSSCFSSVWNARVSRQIFIGWEWRTVLFSSNGRSCDVVYCWSYQLGTRENDAHCCSVSQAPLYGKIDSAHPIFAVRQWRRKVGVVLQVCKFILAAFHICFVAYVLIYIYSLILCRRGRPRKSTVRMISFDFDLHGFLIIFWV